MSPTFTQCLITIDLLTDVPLTYKESDGHPFYGLTAGAALTNS